MTRGENAPALARDEAFARIRLLRSPNVGPVSYYQLLRRFGTASAALDALPDLVARGGGRYQPAPIARIEDEIAALRQTGARYLFHDGTDYPALLGALESPPPILTIRGNAGLFARPAVARGIDGAAHRGALAGKDNDGGTIAVIAGGINVIYPPEHAELQEEISQNGLLIAEMPPGTEPLARHFPFRNRIIAGLAAGTVVVEAAPKSGSLITARLAAEAGREVMAIPGSPLDSRSQGCNRLIRDGAILVQSAEDVAELMQGFSGALFWGEEAGAGSSAWKSGFDVLDSGDLSLIREVLDNVLTSTEYVEAPDAALVQTGQDEKRVVRKFCLEYSGSVLKAGPFLKAMIALGAELEKA